MELGERIRDLRLSVGLTQEELADRCELTKGYISQLENDLTSPSIATLIDILSALGTDLKEFFSDDEQEEKVTFNKNEFIEKVTEQYVQNWLVPNAQKNTMEPLHIKLFSGCKTDEDFPHEGEEFGYVLEGKIAIVLGNKHYKCKKGEAFYYQANKPHYVLNKGKGKARFLWISTPPNF